MVERDLMLSVRDRAFTFAFEAATRMAVEVRCSDTTSRFRAQQGDQRTGTRAKEGSFRARRRVKGLWLNVQGLGNVPLSRHYVCVRTGSEGWWPVSAAAHPHARGVSGKGWCGQGCCDAADGQGSEAMEHRVRSKRTIRTRDGGCHWEGGAQDVRVCVCSRPRARVSVLDLSRASSVSVERFEAAMNIDIEA
eukprot:1368205-Rhodomonas_salina.3